MITTIVCSIAIGLLIGVIVGDVIGSHAPYCQHWDYDMKSSKVAGLETRVFQLERENERLNYVFNSYEMKKRMFEEHYAAHCYSCNKTFYSATPKGQEVADLLKNISLTSEEIAKKLDIKIS
jgi:hypothetical protein